MTTTDPVADSVAAYTPHAEAYAADNTDTVSAQRRRLLSQVPVGAVVLDAGCGPGRDLTRFTDAGLRTVGVDANPAFVRMARSACPSALVCQGDLRRLPLANASVDAVWACASLVHLPRDQARAALSELVRAAKPGAVVYASVKGSGDTGWRDTRHGRRWFRRWHTDEIAAEAEDVGLSILEVRAGTEFLDLWAARHG